MEDKTAAANHVPGGAGAYLDEYTSAATHKKFTDSIDGSIRLPVLETPNYANNNFAEWAGATAYGAVPGNSSHDDLAALQAAVDSGRPVIYLPQGSYHISNTLVIRGNVRLFIGLCAAISKTANFPANAPLIRFDGTSGDATILQNLRLHGDVLHNSAKSLAFVNADIGGRLSTASGKMGNVFLEDVIGPTQLVINPGQSVWGRQVNIEFQTGSFIENHGGRLWLLGYKTEGKNGSLISNYGGWVELLGGFFYSNDGPPEVPALVNDNGHLSASFKVNGANIYPVLVRDIRSGETRDFLQNEAPNLNNVGLHSGASAAYGAGMIQVEAAADAHVRDGLPNTNFGSETTLLVKNDGGGWRREAFLKFPLSGVSAQASPVKLLLDITQTGTSNPVTQSLRLAGNTWSESTLTWNNRPAALGAVLATWGAQAQSTVEVDVTAAVQAAVSAGDEFITFKIEGVTSGGRASAYYASRENADPTLRPRLRAWVPTAIAEERGAQADAYVRAGTHSQKNFGSEPVVTVKLDSNADFTREGYFRFDAAGLQQAREVLLVLPVSSCGSALSTHVLEWVPDSAWQESGITWSNRPGVSGAVLAQWEIASAQEEIVVDVTELARSVATQGASLNLRVRALVTGANRHVSYGSREHADPLLRPRLEITR